MPDLPTCHSPNSVSLTILPKNRTPTHAGKILLEAFLSPLGVTQTQFGDHIGVPIQRVNEIVRGRRGVSSEPAWFFAGALGATPEF